MSKDDAYHVLNDGANVHHISGKVTGVEKIGDTIVITIGTS
jgi:hypothetical protein